MYTELNMRCEIKKDAPDFVLKTLQLMIDGDDSFDFPEETKHFKNTRIAWMLKSASYYLHPVPSTKLEGYYFSCLFNIKNYDNEIETFVEWLTPYIDDCSNFLGYKIYEEDEQPTLLYHPNKWV